MTEIIGFILATLIGITLGLVGSGGAILTIPILVYIFDIEASTASTYSLFVVGISALVGSWKGAKSGLLDYKMAVYFGLPSVIAIFLMRKFLMPMLPDILFTIGNIPFGKNLVIMLVFAILMIMASVSMIKKQESVALENKEIDLLSIILRGVFVGALSGFVGVGGGFLIIPALVFSAKLPMKNAVATSLIIIATNSIIGFLGSISNSISIDWKFLLLFSSLSVVGIFVGMAMSKKISNEKLKPIFGWFVLIMGIYIIIKEIS